MEPIKLDGNTLYRRLERIYKVWRQESKLGNTLDSFVVLRGKHDENNSQSMQPRTSIFHEYLIGYEFTETLIVFTQTRVIFFLGQKKKNILDSAIKPANYKGPNVEFLIRNMNEPNDLAMNEILNALTTEEGKARIGKITSEPGIGNLGEEWKKMFESAKNKLEIVDCSIVIEEILSVKEQEEIDNIKVSAKYSCFIMDSIIKKFENVIDDGKKISHVKFSNEIKELMDKPNVQIKFKEKSKLGNIDMTQLEVTSLPIIQSGGKYDLSPSSQNDNSTLSTDIIICKVNTRYRDYNTNVIRTYMIDSDKIQQNNYKILFEAFGFMLSQMNEGVKLSTVYEKTAEFITTKDPNLSNSITDNFGHGIGLEHVNSSLIINASNERKIQQGMVFNVVLSLTNFKSQKNTPYTLQIADTIVIKQNNSKENFTSEISKSLSDIYYNMEDDEEEEKQKNGKEKNSNMMNITVDAMGRKTRSTYMSNEEKAKEFQKRKDHLSNLLKRKNEEFKERYVNRNNSMDEEVQITKKLLTSIKSYNNRGQFPHELKAGKIHVDLKNDTVILPIFKMMVPIHAALIKNVSKHDENSFSFLRINFQTPISGINNITFGDYLNVNQPVFIRDLSYKSKDHHHIANLFKSIKDLSKKVKNQDKEEKEKSDLVVQETLVLLKGKRVALNDVTIRPNIAKKTNGVLEAHQNGFRFTSNKGEKIDIIYKNIKHAFFQPCENELIVLVHFNLHNPILIGKKKSHDVQFYREAGAQTDDLDLRRRGNDYEEYEQELKEKQIREKINDEFQKFTKNVQELGGVEFDCPYRDLAFCGVHSKSSVTLIPTAYCLVSLIEIPFYVLSLDEVDLVYFERVSHNLKNFDMVFVFKDLNKIVQRITAIPMENLEMIKSWLDQCDIFYSEGLYNINWVKIIQKIRKDPQEFLDTGGWGFLHDDIDHDQEEIDEEMANDSSFHDSVYEESEDEESEFTEDSEFEESDLEGDEDLSEEGLSWDELEKNAAKMDRETLKRHDEEQQIQTRGKRGKK